jgi:hypothetical protein
VDVTWNLPLSAQRRWPADPHPNPLALLVAVARVAKPSSKVCRKRRVGSVVGEGGAVVDEGGQWLAGRASGWRVGPVVGDGWPVPCSMFPP